MKEIRILAV